MGFKLLAAILWTVVIAVLSLMPGPSIPDVSWGVDLPYDKIVHILLYGIYTFIIGRYLNEKGWTGLRFYGIVLGIPILYGILMEVLQYALSPSRFFDMLDIIANIIGSIAGLLILKIKF